MHAPNETREPREPGETRDLSALSPWAHQLATTLVSLSSDIALVVDDDGVITSVAQNRAEPMAPSANHWIGRAWVDTVSAETRRKIELLLDEVTRTGVARRREVNHPSGRADGSRSGANGGADGSPFSGPHSGPQNDPHNGPHSGNDADSGGGIPVAYTAVRLGAHGPVLAVGRDMRAIAAIQQRFVDTQQELERVYWQARHADARDQRLHQVATDTVLVVDAQALTIVLTNEAGGPLFARFGDTLVGRAVGSVFDAHSCGAANELLVAARSSGRPGEIRARLAGQHLATSVSATPFRAGDAQRLLVRLRPLESREESSASAPVRAEQLAQRGVVVTDSSGRLLSCSVGLCNLLGVAGEAALKGRALGEWTLDADGRWSELIARARREGLASRVAATLGRADGVPLDVVVGASLLAEGDQECVGLTIERAAAAADPQAAPPHAVQALLEQMGLLLGTAALPELLRRLGALAEQHLVGAALARAGGNLPAAAEVLGVSPDSLGRRVRKLKSSRP